MTEMVCVSPEGRITPGCSGLYTDEQTSSWARIVDYVHAVSTAKIGAQIGHSGRKGSTKLMWDGIDQPLESGNWPLVSASAIPYSPINQTPREMTRADMDRVRDEFVAATKRAAAAGFDLLEVHAAHGYLLSSFLSPVSNKRQDEYGGGLDNRLRFPIEVFDAVRAAWPEQRPLTVRLSATDWIDGGNTVDDAVAIAEAFIAHGADAIDVSSGQIAAEETPKFGRSYQTPFADAIRNRVAEAAGVAVIAVGAISSYDDVNSILIAGRADFVALGRTHLWNPNWALHAAADLGYRGEGAGWLPQYRAGSRKPPSARTDAIRPRLSLVRDPQASGEYPHRRWTPATYGDTVRA
jgi:anthraniloyl-CoA monooxygenase